MAPVYCNSRRSKESMENHETCVWHMHFHEIFIWLPDKPMQCFTTNLWRLHQWFKSEILSKYVGPVSLFFLHRFCNLYYRVLKLKITTLQVRGSQKSPERYCPRFTGRNNDQLVGDEPPAVPCLRSSCLIQNIDVQWEHPISKEITWIEESREETAILWNIKEYQ